MANRFEDMEEELARKQDNALAETRRTQARRDAPEKATAEDTWANAGKYVRNKFSAGMADTLGFPVDAIGGLINMGIGLYGHEKEALAVERGAKPGETELPAKIDYFGGSKTFDKPFMVDRKIKPTGEVNRFLGGTAQIAGGGVPIAAHALKKGITYLDDVGKVVGPQVTTGREVAKVAEPIVAGELTAAATAQGASEAAKNIAPDSTLAQIAAPLIAAPLVGGWAQARVQNIGSAAEKANAMAQGKTGTPLVDMVMDSKTIHGAMERKVKSEIARDLKSYLDSEKSLTEATDLAAQFPGTRLTPGQASGAPGIKQREEAHALSSSEALNRRLAVERQNQQALMGKVDSTLPDKTYSATRTVRDIQRQEVGGKAEQQKIHLENIKKLDAEIEALDKAKIARVTSMRNKESPEQVGTEIKALQKELKDKYEVKTEALYANAQKAADKEGAHFYGTGFIEQANDLMTRGVFEQSQADVPKLAKLISSFEERAELMSFKEIKGVRGDLNKAIAAEKRSQAPGSLERLRELGSLRNTLDNTINESEFTETAQKYRVATDYYRDIIVPKFYEGENLEIRSRGTFGTPRVENAEVAAKYLVKGDTGVAPMNRYLAGFAESPAGMKLMEAEFMDRYAKVVAPYGKFTESGQAKFMEDYKAQLDKMTEAGSDIKKTLANADTALARISEEKQYRMEHREELANSDLAKMLKAKGAPPMDPAAVIQKALASKQDMVSFLNTAEVAAIAAGRDKNAAAQAVASTVFNRAGKSVLVPGDYPHIDPKGLREFLTEKRGALMPLFARAYGAEKAKEYITTLESIARMAEIQTRSQMSREKLPLVNTGKTGDPIKESTGMSALSIFPIWRAIIAGRTSTTQAGTAVGTQIGTHMVLKKMGDIEQQILSDPDSAKKLLELMRSGPQTASKTRAHLELAASVGSYLLGTKHYGPLAQFLAPSIVTGAANKEKEKKAEAEKPKRKPLGPYPTRKPQPLELLMNP